MQRGPGACGERAEGEGLRRIEDDAAAGGVQGAEAIEGLEAEAGEAEGAAAEDERGGAGHDARATAKGHLQRAAVHGGVTVVNIGQVEEGGAGELVHREIGPRQRGIQAVGAGVVEIKDADARAAGDGPRLQRAHGAAHAEVQGAAAARWDGISQRQRATAAPDRDGAGVCEVEHANAAAPDDQVADGGEAAAADGHGAGAEDGHAAEVGTVAEDGEVGGDAAGAEVQHAVAEISHAERAGDVPAAAADIHRAGGLAAAKRGEALPDRGGVAGDAASAEIEGASAKEAD